MTLTEFSSALLAWYAVHARDLPWRSAPGGGTPGGGTPGGGTPGGGTPPSYPVWVSEIMLQQTRVETVIPYYQRWMERFPTLESLARASEQEVLALWEGLGYYSRARNLHRAARQAFFELGGELPASAQALRRLPGIGRYTAGAIASIAFGEDAAALDGNIRRVLARVFDVDLPARSPQGERRLWELAEAHLPPGRAADYNQALMDLGATICTPRRPDCPNCPLNAMCAARRLGIQEQRPVELKKAPTPHHTVTAAVIHRRGRLLIAQRPSAGLLGGLWEFPGGKQQPGEDLPACLRREIQEELDANICVGAPVGVYRHAYTHFRVTLHAFHCTLLDGSEPRPMLAQALRWALTEELSEYPMGKIDRQISRDLIRAGSEAWIEGEKPAC